MQKTLGLMVKEIGQLSDTRRACRWKSVEAVKSNYAAVFKSLVELSDPCDLFSGGNWSQLAPSEA